MLKEGDVLNSRYKVQQLIGKGGMSSVYLATDMNLHNKLWAVKEVNKNATDQAGRPIEQSLATEANLLSKLDHPMIVNIADIITTDKYIYVVMDYVEGKSLDKVVREEGPQSEEDVQNWMIQICDALDYLHKQDPPIIYRDMKPSNIMLRPDGYVKLIDLGVAREYKDQSRKDTIAFGTEGYAPPEQYGKAQTDPRADIYALGATMWHLLSGEAPQEYPLPDIRTKNPKVREGFAHVIVPKCCQLEREARYQNCDELVADLEVYHELTRSYYNEQKRKVDTFTRLLVAGLACLVAGFICFQVGNFIVTRNWESAMEIARTSYQDPAKSEAAYKEAISCKPGDPEAYVGLLNMYQTTGKGSEEYPLLTGGDLSKVNDLVHKYDNDLKNSGAFAKVSYEMGKAAWDNYSVGDNNSDVLIRVNAMNAAKPHFENASGSTRDNVVRENSDMYISIANFQKQIEDIENGNDESTDDVNNAITSCVFSLEKLLSNVTNDDSPASSKVKLNAYAVIQSALNSGAPHFKKAGIGKDRLEKLCQDTYRGLQTLSFGNNSLYRNAKSNCVTSLNEAVSRIQAAYNSVGNK